jgi:glycosyltransferase involved in cell wall biosynthesis
VLDDRVSSESKSKTGMHEKVHLLDRNNVAAVIPAYEEAKHVRQVAERTRKQLDRVLVVDDGSTDATTAEARAGGAEVISHRVNRGKGESIKTGLRHWLADPAVEWIVLLDADGQHLPEEIGRFFTAATTTTAGLYVGTRMNDVHEMPLLRRAVNRYMSHRISRLCGQEVPDTQCGYRMIARALTPHLLAGTSRFDYETEMLIVASREGFGIDPLRDTIGFFELIRRYEKSDR